MGSGNNKDLKIYKYIGGGRQWSPDQSDNI